MEDVTQPGDFDARVTLLQRVANTPNELGETTTTDNELRSVWAKVVEIASKEGTANAETTLDITHVVRLQYGVDTTAMLTHADAIQFGGMLLEIDDITIYPTPARPRELRINCKEYVP